VLRSGSGEEAGHQRGGAGAQLAVSRGGSLHGGRREATQTSRDGGSQGRVRGRWTGAGEGEGEGEGRRRGDVLAARECLQVAVSSSRSCVGFAGAEQKFWDADGLHVSGRGPWAHGPVC
jgi:hypothetical protein